MYGKRAAAHKARQALGPGWATTTKYFSFPSLRPPIATFTTAATTTTHSVWPVGVSLVFRYMFDSTRSWPFIRPAISFYCVVLCVHSYSSMLLFSVLFLFYILRPTTSSFPASFLYSHSAY